MLVRLLILIISSLQHTNAETFIAQCFTPKADFAISNSSPIAELFRVTVSECLNYCILNAAKIGDGCASIVYHNKFNTCQLYGHNGKFEGSEVVSAEGHSFYQRTSWIGACQDRVVPKHGYQQRPKTYAVNTARSHRPLAVPSFSAPNNSEPTTKLPATVEPDRQDTSNSEIEETSENTIQFLNPTHSSKCEKGEKVSYFVIFGHKLLSSQKSAHIKGVDQSSCIMYCSQNINNIGVSMACFSANYDPVEEQCDLYGKQAQRKRGLATLAVDRNFIFADKFCVQTKKDCSAESPYIVYPFKQMHKHIVHSIPEINSVVACVAACIDYSSCKAITYKKGLCIMHGASPASDPSLIVDGSEYTMVVENGCQLTAEALPSMLSNTLETGEAQWQDWSPCQFGRNGKKMRVRQRQCTDCEDLQLEACT